MANSAVLPYSLEVTTAATTLPLTLGEIKRFLQIEPDVSDFDPELEAIMRGAVDYIEKITGRFFIDTVVKQRSDGFPNIHHHGADSLFHHSGSSHSHDHNDFLELRANPVDSATVPVVTYVATDGVSTVWAASNWDIDYYQEPARLRPSFGIAWPVARNQMNAVDVVYTVGYGTTADDVPKNIKQVISVLTNQWFCHRGSMGRPEEIPHGITSMIDNLRWDWP